MIQFRLWDDCNNRCSFCSLRDRQRNHTIRELIERLDALTQIIPSITEKEVGLIGGELFISSDKAFIEAWMRLIDAINESDINTLYLATNLLNFEPLEYALMRLEKDVWVCTSYDEVGRFRTIEDKFKWWATVKDIHEMDRKVHCTMIPSQELITGDFEPPGWMDCDLCEPIVTCEWYRDVDKKHYREELLSKCQIHLPRRKDMITWFSKHPAILENYIKQADTHASDILEFVDNDFKDTYTNRFCKNLAPCGHQYWSRCYADSDKCMMCDAKMIKG